MSLTSMLPPPRYSDTVQEAYESEPDSDDDLEAAFQQQTSNQIQKSGAPPYGHRRGWAPRKPEDFGDGGAFPEIHMAQFPLGMGKKKATGGGGAGDKPAGKTLALQTNASGEIMYDALVRQGHDKDRIVYSSYKDLVPTEITKQDPLRELPAEEEIEETAKKTREALEKVVTGKVAAAQPTNIPKQNHEATFIRYTPAQQGVEYNSGAKQRVIRMVEVQKDPLEPPKFKNTNKLPRGPPSPPAPVLHSPPRKVSSKEQQDWKIPPCISNWKNSKGYTIPLHMRLAADGRGLQDVQINDKFAKFAEAMYIAERTAREGIEKRHSVANRVNQVEKEKREQALRDLAQQAREEQANFGAREDDVDDEVVEREQIRRDRRRERERQINIDRAAPDKRQRLMRDQTRDVTERIALGLPATAGGIGGGFDERLYNQAQGTSAGFGAEDDYNVYDKAFRNDASNAIYRPSRGKDADFGEDDYERIKSTDKFRADKGFSGTEGTASRSGPVQFEKEHKDEELLGLDKFLADAKKGGKRGADDRDDDRREGRRSKRDRR
eukprot:m.481198 g.481198  ORF g.481198 m.481198 type:complete len:550 (+) comp22081_c0_seq1:116-1765(+)